MSSSSGGSDLGREMLALKRASDTIRRNADASFVASHIDLAHEESRTELVRAIAERTPKLDAPQLRLPLKNEGRKIGELGGKGWIFNPDGETTDSYATVAQHLDSLGATIQGRYKGGKRSGYTPGQFAAHAALLAFKGKDFKLRTEYGLSDQEIDHLKLHTSVLMGAEVGRTPVAGVSNFLMLHRMKHVPDSRFSGDTGTLTGIQKSQLATRTTEARGDSFLSAPYGSLTMMQTLQKSIDTFPDTYASRYSKSTPTYEAAWRGAFTKDKIPKTIPPPGGKSSAEIVPMVFEARDDSGPSGARMKIQLPPPLDVADTEARRLRAFVDYKSHKHGRAFAPEEALEKSVLKHFPEPWEHTKARLGIDDSVAFRPRSILSPLLPSTRFPSHFDAEPVAASTLPGADSPGRIPLFDARRGRSQSVFSPDVSSALMADTRRSRSPSIFSPDVSPMPSLDAPHSRLPSLSISSRDIVQLWEPPRRSSSISVSAGSGRVPVFDIRRSRSPSSFDPGHLGGTE